MTGSIWDEFGTGGASGSWFKFEAVGDEIKGTVDATRVTVFPGQDGKPDSKAPTLTLDGVDVTCGTVDLKAKLRDLRPEVGDWVRIKYVAAVPNKHGGKSKVFDVEVRKSAPVGADEAPF